MSFIHSILNSVDRVIEEKQDLRTSKWLLMSSPLPTLGLVSLYLLAVVYIPKYMASRKPFDLKGVLMVYNFCLVLLSAYMFFEFLMTSWLKPGFSLICENVDYSDDYSAIRLTSACWWFFFSKLIELLDTIFFVLRKKDNQVSFLHVYHHSTMPLLWWIGVKFVGGGEAYFSASINCFIHVLMYMYYLLAAMGPHMQKYLWWKKYMTTLQLLQFWAILIHTTYAIYTNCGYPLQYGYALLAYDLSHIVLFSNFYYQTYMKKARMKAAQKGETANGYVKVSNGVHLEKKKAN